MMTPKFSKLFLIISITALLSCDKSDDPGPSIVGSWKLLTSESYDCDLSTDNGIKTCGTYAWCTTITFNSDKTFKVIRTSDNIQIGSGTYILTKGMLALDYSQSSSISTYKITISGNTMIINSTGETLSCSSNDTYGKV